MRKGWHYFKAALLMAIVPVLLSRVAFTQDSEAVQQTSAAEDVFAPWHRTLSEAADKTLAAALADKPWMKAPESRAVAIDNSSPSTNLLARLQAAIERVQKLRTIIEPILYQEGVPTELSAVVLVESGGRIAALSPRGARGIWQFMPDTARRYGLVVNSVRDDRTDVEKSTHAAARYLRDLYAQFADWSLVLAAYNAGELAIQNAMNRAQSRDFPLIRSHLPPETRNYVPAVVAAMNRLQFDVALDLHEKRNNSTRVIYALLESGS